MSLLTIDTGVRPPQCFTTLRIMLHTDVDRKETPDLLVTLGKHVVQVPIAHLHKLEVIERTPKMNALALWLLCTKVRTI